VLKRKQKRRGKIKRRENKTGAEVSDAAHGVL
jgi:hypothetical protein